MTIKRYQAETTDSVMFLLNREHLMENLIQIEMVFDYSLDRKRLLKAFELILIKYPIAACRFVEDMNKPYFETLQELPEILSTGSMDEYIAFINEPVSPETGPMLHAFLHDGQEGDRLAIKVSHVLCDVGGLKELTASIAEIYRTLEIDADFIPPEVKGSRSFKILFSHLPFGAYPKIFLNSIKEMRYLNIPSRTHTLPLKNVPMRPFEFIKRHISSERASRIQSYGKGLGVTLNDVFLAAFLRALMRFPVKDSGYAIRTGFTVDQRMWALKVPSDNISNLSTWEFIRLDKSSMNSLEETVSAIGKLTTKRKNNYFGLNQVLWLLFFSMIPYSWTKLIWSKLVRSGIRTENSCNPISNYGSIPEKEIVFDKAPVHAWILTPIMMPPGLWTALSSYRGEITVSAGTPIIASEKTKIEMLLDMLIEEIPK
jgi:NRPS condensation-like uncharacterized protein